MTENLVVGRGKVYFAPYARGSTTGGTKGFFGNVPEFSLSQNVTNLDHYRSTGGLKVKDRTVQLQVDATITFTTDNISIANLQLWFGGSSSGSAPSDAPTDIGTLAIIGSSSQIFGALFYESDNPVGDNINIWAPYVSLRPNANYGLIADTWQSLGFIAECLKRDESSERVYVYTPTGGAASSDAALDTSPTYITAGTIDVASTPATPATGGTVTGHGGVAAAASTIEYTLTGGNEAWAFYHNGTANVGSAYVLTGASGTKTTVLPVAGTYTVKAYGNSAGTGSAVATSSSITVS